uniref:Uncharacterized protein n=1 Tax=Periophthalmus magnuspinnatus TaxID=409849 RepID=A0A3B4BLH7_9GOBI
LSPHSVYKLCYSSVLSLWHCPLGAIDLKLPYPGDKAFLYDTFPEGFVWAVGTAAYQVEGAFEKDGKGLSIWDTFTRGGNRLATGDVGSDSYHNVQADIRAIRQLGVTHYRFSLSWARIFPNGTRGSHNEMGTNYYRTLIKKLKEIRVQPVVTLYHWDLPEHLQHTLGGWTNPHIVELFKDYADFCFHTFGDDVRYWITIDNPFVVAQHGYGTGVVAPGIKNDPDLPFRVGHILLKAHATVWHLYHSHYRHRQKGRVSMALASHWIKPSRTRRESLRECQCSLDHVLGWFARPLFTDGDYPPCMKERLGSKLPSFTPEERDFVKGTADFFALSHGAALSFQLINDSLKFGQQEDLDLRMLLYWVNADRSTEMLVILVCTVFYLEIYHFYSFFYIYVFACCTFPNRFSLIIHIRILIHVFVHLSIAAIVIDGVNVIGYTAWSLIDGFEWYREYGIRRGLYYVDFNTPDMKREPKTSATFYRQVLLDRELVWKQKFNLEIEFNNTTQAKDQAHQEMQQEWQEVLIERGNIWK